ncbi:uncharacterized protein M421DRAFT_217640 [Didymella exigua CBS 183.55]|uniref:Uncharacterized protein n=1 Tax=Didymella exigua CBS 183.55 TaxID=1150837 RepID=A0A6A5RFJ2_9PLEO|nr:uncharacterized protein M421DRAFT_217640 [Didymella exigua CBS 183.55]KAF1926492.1 hypothetical protein M421DRAFT_217640 [Didymella exigua CBS 183.55]
MSPQAQRPCDAWPDLQLSTSRTRYSLPWLEAIHSPACRSLISIARTFDRQPLCPTPSVHQARRVHLSRRSALRPTYGPVLARNASRKMSTPSPSSLRRPIDSFVCTGTIERLCGSGETAVGPPDGSRHGRAGMSKEGCLATTWSERDGSS